MFLYRDEYYNIETEEKGIGECIIAKQRNGPVGTVKMAWIGAHSKFADLELVHKEQLIVLKQLIVNSFELIVRDETPKEFLDNIFFNSA